MIDSRLRELSVAFQKLHPQLNLQIGELELLIIRSESQCERNQERFITSNGKNQIQFE